MANEWFSPASLPTLEYSYEDLKPAISAKILKPHYLTYHQTCIDNYNKAIEQLNDAMNNGDATNTFVGVQRTIKFNGGGHINHSIFWKNLAPVSKGGGVLPPDCSLDLAVKRQFGSLELLIQKMKVKGTALQGPGWVWLGVDKEIKNLVIETTDNEAPLMTKGPSLVPLLGIDVWEHAYDSEKENAKADYLENIWKIMNWKYANEVYDKGVQ